ncbi:MAG: hypothetical protein ABEK50_10585 [bacterium]
MDQGSDLKVMITRRQAFMVRGDLGTVPDYQFRELQGRGVAGPNVKTFPVIQGSRVQDTWVEALYEISEQVPFPVSFSYSPVPARRAELVEDDICVISLADNRFQIVLGTGSGTYYELSPPFQSETIPHVREVLTDRLPSFFPLEDANPRNVRKRIVAGLNEKKISKETGASRGTRTVIEEGAILTQDNHTLFEFHRDPTHWIMIPTPAGHLSLEHLDSLIDMMDCFERSEVILTPEQNILIAGRNSTQTKEMIHEATASGWYSGNAEFYSRISTCPGALFCSNASQKPIQLAEQIADQLSRSSVPRKIIHSLPIGITGCGATTHLERLHPVGIAPSQDGGYDLYSGGRLDGEGKTGELESSNLPPDEVPAEVETLFKEYTAELNPLEMDDFTSRYEPVAFGNQESG